MSTTHGYGFRSAAAVVSGALLLSACASSDQAMSGLKSGMESSVGWVGSSIDKMTGPEEPLTPAEERLRQRAKDFNRTIFEGMLVGMGGGAAAGAGIGALSSNDRGKGALIGALIGAVGGAAAGAAGGYYYANMKERYISQEDRLDAMTAGLRDENAKLQATLVEARTVVAEKKRLVADVGATAKKESLSKADVERKLMSVDRNIELLRGTIEDREKRLAEFRAIVEEERQNGQSEKLASLQQQIVSMEKTTALLQAEVDALSSRRASITG